MDLPRALLALIWPASRLLMGLRVHSTLRKDLLEQGTVLLKGRDREYGAIGDTVIRNGLPCTSTLTQLRTHLISMDCSGLSADGLNAILTGFHNTATEQQLVDLTLTGDFGDGGLLVMATLLRRATGLRTLVLGTYHRRKANRHCGWWLPLALIGPQPRRQLFSFRSASLLANALDRHHSLTQLDLQLHHLGMVGATALARGLGRWPSLTYLDLMGNGIRGAGVVEVTRAASSKLA